VNIKEYIESGILESYALGELTPQEESEVLSMAEKYVEVKQELAKIEAGIEELAMKTSIKPSDNVKNKLFDSIDEKDSAKVVDINTHQSSPHWRYIAAASVSIAVISSVLAYNYWEKWQSTQQELSTLIAQNERVAQDYNQVNEKLDLIESQLEIINNSAFQRVKMRGTDNSPNSLALVYWNDDTEEVYLSVQNLQQLSEEKQYQLWALIDGKPFDAGVFNADPSGLFKMKNITQGAGAFAVTIEPKGGSESPTLETMQVMGAVTNS